MTRRLLRLSGGAAVLLVTVALSHPESSGPAQSAAPPAATQAIPAVGPALDLGVPLAAVHRAVSALADAVTAARAVDAADTAGLARIAAPLLAHVDVPYVTRLLLGQHWQRASTAQRAALQAALIGHLVARHGPRLRQLTDLRVSPLAGQVRLVEGDTPRARVPVLVSGGTLPETRVDLHLLRRDGRWRLYDASLHGIGLVGLQRPVFTALAARHGLDGLPALLRDGGPPAAATTARPDAVAPATAPTPDASPCATATTGRPNPRQAAAVRSIAGAETCADAAMAPFSADSTARSDAPTVSRSMAAPGTWRPSLSSST